MADVVPAPVDPDFDLPKTVFPGVGRGGFVAQEVLALEMFGESAQDLLQFSFTGPGLEK